MRFCSDRAGRGVLAWIAVLLACALIARVGQAQAPSPGVFSTFQTDLVPDISLALEPATMRSRVVGVDTQQLTAARLGQETLRLNLFDDVAVAVRIDRVRPTRFGYFITGRPQGFEWGEVRLVVNGPVTVGTVVTPQGKYTIRYGGAGRHIVREVDPSQETLEDDVVESPPASGPPQAIAPGETLPVTPLQGITPGETLPATPLPSGPPQAIAPGGPLAAVVRPATDTLEDQPTEDGSEVRVLVVYTPSMLRHQGGTAGMDAVIDLMIQSANEAFEVSEINPRLVLAHTASVSYVEETSKTDVHRLQTPDDGYMDEVHALRNEYAADLVHLITLRVAGPGGSARKIGNESLSDESTAAFAVTASDREETFTHEIGHNFGLSHDRFSASLVPPIYPYAYGYQNNRAFEPDAPASARWSTIMAYADRCANAGFYCPLLMRFSNPDQTYLGDPLGVPADDPATGPEGPADARLAVNRTAQWVGSFRSEACTGFAVSPQTPVAPVEGGEVIVQLETAPGCLWEATSQSEFLAFVSDARRAGPGLVSINAEPNETGAQRVGTVTVAGMSVEVRQLATDAGICSRSPSVILAIAADESCDEVTEAHLSQIAVLDLGSQRLAPLKAGDFAGLTSLQSLSLEGGRLTELPTGLFSKLSNLTDLNLRDNELTELPDGLFAGLSSLERLRLDRNRLTRLTPGLFSDLANLQELDLSHNELSTLQDGLFAGLTGLRQLHLYQNRLATLSGRPFAELSRLGLLHLANNQLSELPASVFDGLSALNILQLGENSLTTVPAEAFEGLAEVWSLDLSGNRLTDLTESTFSGLPNLYWLDLDGNQIANLPPGLFADVSRLVGLNISHNNVTTLPEGLFSGLNSLTTLQLQENQLSSLPDGILSGLSALESLSLYGNNVDPLPLGLTLEKVGEDRFKAVAPTGAPFELVISVSSDGGTIEGDAETVTIPAGAVEGTPLGVTRVTGSAKGATVDMDTLPELPSMHSGYVFEKDETLPLAVFASIDPADATLSGLWLSQERLSPAFSPDTTRYIALFAHSALSVTVTPTTSHASATVAFHDDNDDALPDADADADGHQVRLNTGENILRVEVTAENGTSTQAYTLVLTREENHCERTEEVLAAILASVPDVEACGDLRNAHLANISRLDLHEQGISSLKSGDFASLSALKVLLLQRNQLTELPAGVFSGLSALEILWLETNQLTELPAGVFSGLSSLEFLNLPGNQLESLPENVFSGLSALRVLSLRSNRLSHLSDEIFSGLSGLELLNLENNQIASLPPKVFSDLSSLRSLTLHTNDLTSVPADAFSGLAGLHDLILAANGLTNLPPGLFSGLTVLRTLSLRGNDLSSVPADSFSELSELEHLSLAGNAFVSLRADLFSGLAALEELELEANHLSALQSGLFAGLSNLGVLNLRANAVEPLPISVSLQSEAGGRVKAVVPTGAPFALELSLSVGGGGRIDGDTNIVSVPTGAVESAPLRVTRIDENADTATVDIASLPSKPESHQGYVLTRGAALPLEITLPEELAPPAQVAGVEIARGGKSLRVLWSPVSGADGYRVQWKVGDEDYDAETRQAVVAGGDTVSYTITGLTDGIEYSVRVLATREGADDGPFSVEVAGTTRSGDPDVNGDGALDGDDAQIMYYAYRFPSLVGDGETGGTEASRQRFLAGYSGLTDPTDEALREMVRKANVWATEGLDEGGDINADGTIDGSDARAMNYAYRYESLLGDGEEGGAARFRLQLLGPLAGKAEPTDEDLKAMLRRANELREAYGQ